MEYEVLEQSGFPYQSSPTSCTEAAAGMERQVMFEGMC